MINSKSLNRTLKKNKLKKKIISKKKNNLLNKNTDEKFSQLTGSGLFDIFSIFGTKKARPKESEVVESEKKRTSAGEIVQPKNYHLLDCLLDNISPLLFFCTIINRLCYQNHLVFAIAITKIVNNYLNKEADSYLGMYSNIKKKTYWELISDHIKSLPSGVSDGENYANSNFIEKYLGKDDHSNLLSTLFYPKGDKKIDLDHNYIKKTKKNYQIRATEGDAQITPDENMDELQGRLMESLEKEPLDKKKSLSKFFYVRDLALQINNYLTNKRVYFAKMFVPYDKENGDKFLAAKNPLVENKNPSTEISKIDRDSSCPCPCPGKNPSTEIPNKNIEIRWINHQNGDLHCYLVLFKDLDTVIISFRGMTSVKSISQNFNYFPILTDKDKDNKTYIQCANELRERLDEKVKEDRKKLWQKCNETAYNVHVKMVNRVFNTIINTIKDLLKDPTINNPKIICTGHSLGGGLATYFSYMYTKHIDDEIREQKLLGLPNKITCIALNPMRVFNQKARDKFEEYVNNDKINYLLSFTEFDFSVCYMPSYWVPYKFYHPYQRDDDGTRRDDDGTRRENKYYLKQSRPILDNLYGYSTLGSFGFDMSEYLSTKGMPSKEFYHSFIGPLSIRSCTFQSYIDFFSAWDTGKLNLNVKDFTSTKKVFAELDRRIPLTLKTNSLPDNPPIFKRSTRSSVPESQKRTKLRTSSITINFEQKKINVTESTVKDLKINLHNRFAIDDIYNQTGDYYNIIDTPQAPQS